MITGYTVKDCGDFKGIYVDLNEKFKANIAGSLPHLKPGEECTVDEIPLIQL